MAGYQVMPRLSPEEYQSLERDIIENGIQVPIIVASDGTIVDGHHRDEIARKHSLHCPRRTVEGDAAKLRSMAYSLNLHRRHLNREQKRELIAQSLKDDPGLSNREHGKRIGANHETVGSVRREMESTGEIRQSDSRVSGDGRIRPATPKPRLAPVPDPPEKPAEAPTPEPESALSFDDEPDDGTPEWEEVAHIPPARLKDVSRPTAVNIPQKELDELNNAPGTPLPEPTPTVHKPLDEEYHNPKEHFIDLMSHLKKASKAIEDAIFTAKHIDSWDGGPLSGDLRDLLDQLDAALNGGSFDAELARLIEGEGK